MSRDRERDARLLAWYRERLWGHCSNAGHGCDVCEYEMDDIAAFAAASYREGFEQARKMAERMLKGLATDSGDALAAAIRALEPKEDA
jgi:hypothetical protein